MTLTWPYDPHLALWPSPGPMALTWPYDPHLALWPSPGPTTLTWLYDPHLALWPSPGPTTLTWLYGPHLAVSGLNTLLHKARRLPLILLLLLFVLLFGCKPASLIRVEGSR